MLGSEGDAVRYGRQLILKEVGPDGQARLSEKKVVVVGAGGLGSAILPILVGAGVACVRLIDHDIVSLSNLPRQLLYTEEDIGAYKVDVASRRLRLQNHNCHIETYRERLTQSNASCLLSDADIIVDGTDNATARIDIDTAAKKMGLPWLYASLEGWRGQLALFLPCDEDALGYTDLFGDEEHEADAGLPIAVMTSTPAIIGSLAAAEVFKYLLELPCDLSRELLLVDTLRLSFTRVRR